MIDILEVEKGIWVLEEDGQNVLLKDCQRFGINRGERKALFEGLQFLAEALAERSSYIPLIKRGLLKKLERQREALEENLWEIRSEGRGGRIVFVMKEPNSIVISAVDKKRGSLNQAIHRGVNRWKRFLREKER